MNMPRLFFTICSANYLPYAYTLEESLKRVLPGARFITILSDEAPGGIELKPGTILGSCLEIPNYFDMAMRYDIVEFNTSIKPFVISYLFKHFPEIEEVYYLDPDLYFFSEPKEIFEAFQCGAEAVFTPHITEPVEDGLSPDDFSHMRSGVYNLGFGAFRRCAPVMDFLGWWSRRLTADCRIDLENGIFVDQKYMDFAPSFLDKAVVLRAPGLNVAYWNLPHRKVVRAEDGQYTVNGEALRFFHFSGVDPLRPTLLSKHQERYPSAADAGPAVAELVEMYAGALLRHGYQDLRKAPYAYARLSDGTPITRDMRRIYGRMRRPDARTREEAFAPDLTPYNRAAADVEFRLDVPVTELMHEIWRSRQDLQHAFPLSTPEGRRGYYFWFKGTAAKEHGVPEPLLEPLKLAEHASPDGASENRRAVKGTRKPSYGATLFGFLRAETGVGEVGRRTLRALEATAMPITARNFSSPVFEEPDKSAEPYLSHRLPYLYHLYQINADNTARLPFMTSYGDWFGRYNIGMWAWELPRFPSAFRAAFDYVDEVWTPSEFVRDSVRQATDKPVVTIPHAVPIEEPDPRYDRSYFGLAEDGLVVLATLDFNSFSTRKNPFGAIDAFRLAFNGRESGVQLALKVHGRSASDDRVALSERICGADNITLIDRVLSRAEMTGLQAACDVFLSLHRSEGFGLNIAECMGQGKLVIATNFSGNRDFLDASCGAPVDFSLVPVRAGEYPHGEGQWWADPDVDQAGELLRRSADDKAWRLNLAASARRRVATRLSLRAVGYAMRGRIDDLEFARG